MEFKTIGTIRTPFQQAEGAPVQPVMAKGAEGAVELLPEYAEGLADLHGFERIWLVYWFDRTISVRLHVRPYMEEAERGVFATRAPCRPNAIGMSCVRLVGVERTRLRVADVDILDGTPLLDIKPYVPRFDSYPESKAGWLDQPSIASREFVTADGRFERKGGKQS